jgi:predicted ester cyclase
MVGAIGSVRPFDGFVASVKGAKVSFDHQVQLSSHEAFSGREADILAADFVLKAETMVISGEMARDKNGSVAASLGLYSEPTPMLRTVLAARIYPPSFNSLHGFALSEGGLVEGEEGLYFGAAIRPSSWINASFFYDVYTLSNRFPFRRGGNDFLAKARIRLSRRWEMSVQYRRQNKPGMFHSDEHGLEYVRSGQAVQERYRWSLLFAASDALHWQSRIEATVRMSDSHAGENGYMAFQEMRWQAYPSLRLSVRLVVFETDSYDSRLYAYEPDVPGGFSNIPLWDGGFRTYILLEFALAQGIRIYGKYSRLFREPSLPGDNIGFVKERFTVQCDVSF